MDTEQKLNILTDSSKYDLACACKMKDEPGRVRGDWGRWIYPAALPDGRKVFLLKTLQSNHCVNDCSYCPFNHGRDLERTTINPEEMAGIFIQLLNSQRVNGLFLSSGVCDSANATMRRMLDTVELIRYKHKFKGFIHLKVIPGADSAAIEQAVRLATRVSVNIEAPSEGHLRKLSKKKDFHQDIMGAIVTIDRVRRETGTGCKQTTQFVVGAAAETDREIVSTTDRLYDKFGMERVYYSAYQNPELPVNPCQQTLFDDIPPARSTRFDDIFLREHRLYQVDFLLRKYGFSRGEIPFQEDGNLSLKLDPKSIWAQQHPEFFPVALNKADREELLRVPGIGPIGVKKILEARRLSPIRSEGDLRKLGIRRGAWGYVVFGQQLVKSYKL